MKKLLSSLMVCFSIALSVPAQSVVQDTASQHRKGGFVVKSFAGFGIASNNLHFYGSQSSLVGSTFNQPLVPSFNEGLDFIKSRKNVDIDIQVSLTFWRTIYSGHTVDAQGNQNIFTIRQSTMAPAVDILSHLYQRKDVRVYLGAGVAGNYSFYPTNQVYVDGSTPYTQSGPAAFDKFWWQVQVKLGVQLFNRFYAEMEGDAGKTVSTYTYFHGTLSQYGLKVGYYFNGTH